MKKLKLDIQQFEGAELLTRSQLKKVIGGDGGSGLGCSAKKCSGGNWDPVNMKYNYGTTDCGYLPPVGGLPGSCICSFELVTEQC